MANAPKWTPAGVRALAQAVKKRREEIGRNQVQVGEHGGPTNSTMTSIEKGSNLHITWHTLRALDQGLDWPDGNAVRIVSGHEPLDPAVTTKVPLENMPGPQLSELVITGLVELLRRRVQDSEDWPGAFLYDDPEPSRAEDRD